MAVDDRKLVVDVFAWLLNVTSSVMIIFVNKALMTGYRFTFATTMTGLHFMSCWLSVYAAQRLGFSEAGVMPTRDALIFSVVGSIAVGTANISLLVNSVGFYQIAKLLIVPFVCGVEMVWLKKRFSMPVLGCIAAVLVGVGIVTVTDIAVKASGLIIAAVFVVTSGMQQILCGYLQRKFGVTSHQLMANTSHLQGGLLLAVGPFADRLVTTRWISSWEPNVPALNLLMLSCVVAIFTNVSQFMCLGRFTATTFQVLGHAKTVLVLTGKSAFLESPLASLPLFLSILLLSFASPRAVEAGEGWPECALRLPGACSALSAQQPKLEGCRRAHVPLSAT